MIYQRLKLFIFSIIYILKALSYIFSQYFTKPKNDNDPIVIVCASDDQYILLMAAMIKSIEFNIRGSKPVFVYIFSNNIEQNNKTKLIKSFNHKKIIIEFIEINGEKLEALGFDHLFYGLSTHYYRLLIPYVLPAHIKKALYLDCDLIINRDISELWNIKIEDKIILAALDTRCENFSYGIKNYKELGLDPKTMYFNSGVMLIDIDRWKEYNVTQKAIECALKNTKFVRFWDQYALNIIMVNKWKRLNPNWNIYPDYRIGLPFIIHYAGVKPTSENYSNGYKKIFNFYLNKTNWRTGILREPSED